ncbi:hypothetical protein LNTAR_21085 [Lentisphaera araneosa HTCC2155]|uniref:HTH cro/C1-type domain-containing protein n=1 Tax=Lentisphaera araneosa HTCC2155 TaxID=313628 RepID=A6DLV1_9BACT|nr:type II toxin-antitoxin system Y4mF family antitoxin [Lentisphaera araneosa]EDM27249.1 hypothetical protein LNTAR_21085 [Lentisphaera araneosa HTCC2155]
MKEISKIIKEHRKLAGLSQIDLANLSGVGKTTIFDIEKGKESVRFDNLLKVIDILNIQIKLVSSVKGDLDEES